MDGKGKGNRSEAGDGDTSVADARSMQASPPAVIGQRVGAAAGPPNGVVVAQVIRAAPVQPQADATYRLNHKKLHVTLAALEVDEVSNEQVLAMAQMRGSLIEFSIMRWRGHHHWRAHHT